MIIHVPSSQSFEEAGVDFLNLAWDTVMSLVFDLVNAGVPEVVASGDLDETEVADYWSAAHRPLATALVLVQQGTELLLKARIAEVSPFLLLAQSPDEWPSRCDKLDTAFGDFRTHEAHDLLRVHDAVTSRRLSDGFRQQFGELRRKRNAVMHTVDGRTQPKPEELLIAVLEAANELMGPHQWVPLRRGYMHRSVTSWLYNHLSWEDQAVLELPREIHYIVDRGVLTSQQAFRYLGLVKRQRRYICPHCASEFDSSDYTSGDLAEYPNFAQLRPNAPDSTEVYCILCDRASEVARRGCGQSGCKGNVIAADSGACLTCYRTADGSRPG